MKILAIGNSFSQDATAQLQLLSDKITVRNLFIGGCSLERHWHNAEGDLAEYRYEENGAACRPALISISEALRAEAWDVVTFQQCSGKSGLIDSYYPYLPSLTAYVRRFTPAKQVFFQTWAYETDCEHAEYPNYHHNQQEMFRMIVETTREISRREGLPLLRGGEALQALRATPCFDYAHGGLSLNRDGFHLSCNYGRFFMAALWHKYFLGTLPAFLDRADLSVPFATMRGVLEKF